MSNLIEACPVWMILLTRCLVFVTILTWQGIGNCIAQNYVQIMHKINEYKWLVLFQSKTLNLHVWTDDLLNEMEIYFLENRDVHL